MSSIPEHVTQIEINTTASYIDEDEIVFETITDIKQLNTFRGTAHSIQSSVYARAAEWNEAIWLADCSGHDVALLLAKALAEALNVPLLDKAINHDRQQTTSP